METLQSRLDSRAVKTGNLHHSVSLPTKLLGWKKQKCLHMAHGLSSTVLEWNKYILMFSGTFFIVQL